MNAHVAWVDPPRCPKCIQELDEIDITRGRCDCGTAFIIVTENVQRFRVHHVPAWSTSK